MMACYVGGSNEGFYLSARAGKKIMFQMLLLTMALVNSPFLVDIFSSFISWPRLFLIGIPKIIFCLCGIIRVFCGKFLVFHVSVFGVFHQLSVVHPHM